jgi:hypothetical protein
MARRKILEKPVSNSIGRYTISLIFGIALVLAGASGAQAYAGGGVDTNTAGPGSQVNYASPRTGVAPGTDAFIEVDGPLAREQGQIVGASVLKKTLKVGEDGVIRFGFIVPIDAPPGAKYIITVSADDGINSFSDTSSITVAGAPVDRVVTTAGGALGFTGGADLTAALWFGTGALVIGGVAAATAVSRRQVRPVDAGMASSV